MKNKQFDFSGWATKFDKKCSDGRTMRKGAFEHCDGEVVPLIYSHDHSNITSVVGNALLECRPEGVYAYGSFNNTNNGQDAFEMVKHGDIRHLSIYANHLTERGGDVFHGDIKEVSLVLAGANPGAYIDVPYIEHGEDGLYDFEARIYNDDEDMIILSHSDKKKKEDEEDDEIDDVPEADDIDDGDEEDDEEEKKKKMKKHELEHSEKKTIQEIIDTFNDEQKDAFYYVIGELSEDDEDEEDEGNDTEGDSGDMKHNVFDTDIREDNYLSHADMEKIFSDAKRVGSLKEAVLMHEEEGMLMHDDDDWPVPIEGDYGIDRINWLFPEAKLVNNLPPEFIKRDMDWVQKVMGGVHHTPFSRIKSMFANITMEEARARGYMKGNLKKEEVFTLLRRSTDPQTVYKKQKMDRDDIIDITDFDVVSWLKSEMRMMLDEEIARSILIGDGRPTDDEDKIKEEHVRSIMNDKPLYSVKIPVTRGGDDMETAKNIMDAAVRGRKEYKGSGNPVLFTTEDWICEMLLLEDGINHKLYKSEAELATAMRVSSIVTVPVMENVKDKDGKDVYGIIVNLNDYNVGADKGGAVNMFDDFDIDYNQYKYLIETRISGALIKPYSALVLRAAE